MIALLSNKYVEVFLDYFKDKTYSDLVAQASPCPCHTEASAFILIQLADAQKYVGASGRLRQWEIRIPQCVNVAHFKEHRHI